MKKQSVFYRFLIAVLLVVAMLAGVVPAPEAAAAGTVYSGAGTVALVYDQSDCYSMQGFGIYGNYLYAVKANTSNNANACIARINKDTGETVYMTDSSGNKYFTYLGHANDMDIVNVNGLGNMFITTGKPGSGSLVRFSMSGTKLTKVGSYNVTYNGSQVSYGGVSVMHTDNQYVTFMFKTGSNFFTGKLDLNQSSGTIELTKLFNINKTAIDFGGTIRDLSGWVDQGFEYYDNKIFVPLTGNHQTSTIATSAIAVYNVEGASGVISNDPTYSFYINSTVYPGLFEIESLGICPYDGKLYFSTNGRKSSSSTNYDGVHVVNSFVYQPDNRPSTTGNFRWEVIDDVLTPVTTNSNSYNGLAHMFGSISGGTMTNGMYCVSEPIILNHGTRWIVEWKTSGTGNNHMLLSTESSANNPGHTYLLCSTGNGIIAFGYTDGTTGKNHNYGINLKDHGIDGTAEHVYQLYNKLQSGGSNMIYLSVDGVEIGAMNNYFVGLTSQNTTSDWLSGKDLKFSYFGSHEYRISKSNLEYIQVWGKSLQHSVDEPDIYRWEMANDGFNAVSGTGLTANTPNVMTGGVSGGKFSGAQYQLSRDVVLRHDRPWVMEWQSEGQFTGGAMLLSAHERNNACNAPYLFRYSGSSLLAFGNRTANEHSNYGINLADVGIDGTVSHVYRLANRINADGSNMIYLSVDGVEIGPMNNYYSGITNKNTKVDWVNGRDFTFSYMGTLQSKINDCSIGYFQIWENGIPAEHKPNSYRWEIGNNAMTSVTTNDFTRNDVTHVYADIQGNTILSSNFRMDKSVVLRHDMAWSVSWDSQGFSGSPTGADMILASSNYHNQKYYRYLLRTRDGDFIGIGELSDTHHNYGLRLSDHNIDPTVAHAYSLRNVVNADGSNMIYLYVDGKEVGPMNGHYKGLTDQNETSDYLSGMDLTFTFMGTYNYLIEKDTLTYIEIHEGCSHSFGAWKETAATCAKDGSRTRTCVSCGYAETEVITAIGHSYKSVVTAPTCTEKGYTTYTCSACGHSYTGDETAVKGHSYKSVVTAPTCTEKGYTTYTCSACGHSYTGDETAVKGHSYTSVVTLPTCTEKGYTTHTCAVCSHSYVDSYVDGTGHDYAAAVTKPTCTAEGYTAYTCSKCGDSYVGDRVSAKGHSYVDGVCGGCGAADPDYVAPVVGYSLVGDMNNWDETIHVMTGEDTVSVTMTLQPGSYEFKIRRGDVWYGNDGIIVNTTATTCEDGWDMSTTANNCTLSASGGEYTFIFNPTTAKLIIIYHDNETEEDPVPNGTITLKNVSLTLEDEISYNVYFQINDMIVSEANMGLIIWDEEPVLATVNGGGTVIEGAVYVPVSGQYAVSTMGVPAKNMADLKYMVVYARQGDGSYVYSKLLTYSAKTYCLNRVQKSSDEKMRALCVAMMNYGAAAQEFFAAHSDYTYTELMNVGFEDYQYLVQPYQNDLLNMPTAVDPAKAGTLGTAVNGFTSRSVSMSADGSFQLNYYFTTSVPVDKVTFYYWTADRYAAVDTLTLANASGSKEMEPQQAANTYWASIPGIAAKDMDKTVFACGVYEKDGVTYSTGVISYSLARYCISRVSSGGDFAQMAAATAVYGYHAKTYFAQ